MSYSFNGTSDYMERTASTPFTSQNNCTMVAWVQVGDTAASRHISMTTATDGTNNYFGLRIETTENVGAKARESGNDASDVVATSSSAITADGSTWQLVHGYFTSTTSRQAGHSGGNLGSVETTEVVPTSTLAGVVFGKQKSGGTGTGFFAGKIAVVAWYNEILSEAELTALVTTQPESASSYSKCVAYWDLRVQDGTGINPTAGQIDDQVGTYDLTIYGPTWSTDNPTLGAGGGSLLLPQYDRMFRQNTLLRM